MPIRPTLMAMALALIVPSPAIWSDSLEIRGGGHLTGEVQKRDKKWTTIQLDDQLRVAIPNVRIRRAVNGDHLEEYRRRAAAAGNDAELHYQLAKWCKAANVPGKANLYKRHHMERAIELDPDHKYARAWLEFLEVDGRWVPKNELMRQRGMISRSSGWMLPEAAAIVSYRDATNKASKKWIQDIKRLVKNLGNSKKSAEAWQSLQAINDPLATAAIAGQLKESREKSTQTRELRMLWVRLLGRLQNMAAVEALVRAGVEENDIDIREAALDQLVQFGSSSAVATYLPMLRSNNNKAVNRAAEALRWFPNPELALTYVDALVTEHKTTKAPGNEMNFGFDRVNGNSGGAFGFGNAKPVTKTGQVSNRAVRDLLREIAPDVDYGLNEQAWREHFARERNSFHGDLRRDP